jgi:hypothetical protein
VWIYLCVCVCVNLCVDVCLCVLIFWNIRRPSCPKGDKHPSLFVLSFCHEEHIYSTSTTSRLVSCHCLWQTHLGQSHKTFLVSIYNFTSAFVQPDISIVMQQIFLMFIKWSSLQKCLSKFMPKYLYEIDPGVDFIKL